MAEDNSFFDGGKYNYENNNTNSDNSLRRKKILLLILGVAIVILLLLSTLKVTGVISVKDKSKPIIYLNGNPTVNLVVGDNYVDEGARAIDKDEGNLSDKVSKTGTVDTSKEGTYTITYSVADKAGNETTKTRTVIVQTKGTPIIVISPNGSETISASYSVTLTITPPDATTIVTSKYQWTTTAVEPTVESFVNDVTGAVVSPEGVAGDYYLWVLAKDSKGGTKILGSNVFKIGVVTPPKIDTTPPLILFSPEGDSNVTTSHTTTVTITDESNIVAMRYLWSKNTTVPSAASIKYTLKNNSARTTPSGATGTYYLWVYAEDEKGNSMIASSKGFAIKNEGTPPPSGGDNPPPPPSGGDNPPPPTGGGDTTPPTISFSMDGNSTYAKSRSTNVTVSDNVAVSTSSLKYQWTTSTTKPAESSFGTAFTNGASIGPGSMTGIYYLWVLAKDTKGNTTIKGSKGFYMDNTNPTCSASGSDVWAKSRTVTVNCSDGHSGVNLCNGVAGTKSTPTYTKDINGYLSYTVSDKAGNTGTCKALVKVDVTAPTATINLIRTDTSAKISIPSSSSNRVWINSSVTVSVSSIKDTGSGINWGNIDLGNQDITNLATNATSMTRTLTATGAYTVSINVFDKLDNFLGTGGYFGIDKVKPTAPSVSMNINGYASASCGTDSNSGLPSKCIKYRIGSYTTSASDLTYSASSLSNTYVAIQLYLCAATVDKAGNTSSVVCRQHK